MVRKQRSDKKKEVKATLKIDLKDAIYRLNYITHTPVKDICEYLCVTVMTDPKYIDKLHPYFQRDLRVGTNIKFGSRENKRIKKRVEGPKERVTIKFKRADYEFIFDLGYALDVSASRVVAILLEIAMADINIVNGYIKQYLQKELSEHQMEELKNLLRYINKENNSHHTWASLLGYILDEVGSPMVKIKDAIADFFK